MTVEEALQLIEDAKQGGRWPPPDGSFLKVLPLDEREKFWSTRVEQNGTVWYGYHHHPAEPVLPPATIHANGPHYDPRPVYAAVRAAGFPAPESNHYPLRRDYEEALLKSLTNGDGLHWHLGSQTMGVYFTTIYQPDECTPSKVAGYIVYRNYERFGPYANPYDVVDKLGELIVADQRRLLAERQQRENEIAEIDEMTAFVPRGIFKPSPASSTIIEVAEAGIYRFAVRGVIDDQVVWVCMPAGKDHFEWAPYPKHLERLAKFQTEFEAKAVLRHVRGLYGGGRVPDPDTMRIVRGIYVPATFAQEDA